MCNASWSEDRTTTLSRLWQDGLSAAAIAKQLGGVTRNAVIGKVHRLGLSGREASRPKRGAYRSTRDPRPPRLPTPRPVRATRRPAAASPPTFPVVPVTAAPEGPGLVASMMELNAHTCRWPIGDPKAADFSFCGRSTKGAYCTGHAGMAFQPRTDKQKARDSQTYSRIVTRWAA
jgi:GcrA cell cycle regulator